MTFLFVQLYRQCRGVDETPLIVDRVRKSVSCDINYGIRFTEVSEWREIRKYFTMNRRPS